MRTQLISLSLILLVVVVVSGGNVPGGRWPIKDLSDPTVVEIAKFAITEHKKLSKVDLEYEKIVNGTEQVVAGTLYDLIIAAKSSHGGATKKYEAVVWEQPWKKLRRGLVSFKAV